MPVIVAGEIQRDFCGDIYIIKTQAVGIITRKMSDWKPRNADEANRRAGGRRRYLAQRREIQDTRRQAVLRALQAQEWLKIEWHSYGLGRTLAKTLKVSEATISRDVQHFMALRLRLGENAQGAFDLMLREERQRCRQPGTW